MHRIALNIREDYPGKTIHLLAVLKGSISYFNDLVSWLRTINSCQCEKEHGPITFDFISITSYDGMGSLGIEKLKVQTDLGPLQQIKGKHVIVVEDLLGA